MSSPASRRSHHKARSDWPAHAIARVLPKGTDLTEGNRKAAKAPVWSLTVDSTLLRDERFNSNSNPAAWRSIESCRGRGFEASN
jgi:hypothetical protein